MLTDDIIYNNISFMSHILTLDKIGILAVDDKGKEVRFIEYSPSNLKKLRKEFELTQDDLAQEMGLKKITISHYEQGVLNNPSVEFLKYLGRFYSQKANYKNTRRLPCSSHH